MALITRAQSTTILLCLRPFLHFDERTPKQSGDLRASLLLTSEKAVFCNYTHYLSSHDILIKTHRRNRESKFVSEILTPTQLQASAASAEEKTGFCRHTLLKGDGCTPAGKQGWFLQFIAIIWQSFSKLDISMETCIIWYQHAQL